MDSTHLDIVHGPANVGNLAWVLSNEMKSMGHESQVVANYGTWLGYPADLILGAAGDGSFRNVAARAINGLRQAVANDVLHYYFGRAFFSWDDLGRLNPFPFADMQLAKLLGKRIVMTYQGCDVRIASRSNANNAVTMCREGACAVYPQCIATLDDKRKQTIQVVDSLADLVLFVNPELGHCLPRGSFLPYGNVDVMAVRPAPRRCEGKPLILHAPSDPHIKGTRCIVEALEALRSEFDFEFRMVEGLPHEEAMRLYADADLLIDQLLAGWYGGLSVELMAMGKPVACYVREEDLGFIPAGMKADLPLYRIHPDSLVDDLRRIFSDQPRWEEVGRQSREFVMRWHHPQKLAKVLLGAYVDPAQYDQLLAEMV